MGNFCEPNVFSKCSFDELVTLYEESKRYNHFVNISETSPLYKYMEEFLKVNQYKTISVFYLQLTRAYIECPLYPNIMIPQSDTENVHTLQEIINKRIQDIKNKNLNKEKEGKTNDND